MTISQSAEYALRAVVWLAVHHDTTLSTPHIARRTKVPPGYLSKVLQTLSRAGLVKSNPGRAGGFRLNQPPEQTRVIDVVNAVDPVKRMRRCPLGLKSHRHRLCPLHRRLDEAAAAVQRAFGETTIAEILAEGEPVKALRETS